MESSHPQKRPRLEDESQGEQPQKDAKLWFEDGNIVVIAQKSAFRVHKSVLSRHSETFAGLFTVPQPTEDADTFDGCPLVRVPDSSHDFRFLLSALYDGVLFLETDVSFNFAHLAALARLGHKYELPQVLNPSIARLRQIFTADFNVWRERLREDSSLGVGNHAIEAVNLFRALGRNDMLPVAFYLCTLLPNTVLLNGFTRRDGTVERLSQDDIIRCLDARASLHQAGTYLIRRAALTKPDRQCRTPSVCLDAFNMTVAPKDFQKVSIHDILHWAEMPFVEQKELCDTCLQSVTNRRERFQRSVWVVLPRTFALKVEGWPVSLD